MPASDAPAKILSANPPYDSAKAWIVTMIAALFFFYEFIQMNMISSLNQALMNAFQVSATKLGILTSAYFIANVLFLLPAGQLLDRYSTRLLITLSMITCIIGTLFLGMTHSLWIAAMCRFLTGIGSAFCFLASIRLASRWFPADKMALVSGLIITLAMLGGWVAQTPFTALIEVVDWRLAIRLDAVLGIVILGLILWLVQDEPTIPLHPTPIKQDQFSYWQSLRLSYFKPQNLLCGLYTCLMNLPIFLMGAIWGSLYLEQIHHFTPSQATLITGMIFFGTVLGSPLAGFISDKLGRRKLPMLVGNVLYLVLILIMIYTPHLTLSAYLIFFFFLGLITSTQVISYPMVAESNPMALTATSVSVVSFLTIGLGGVFFIPLFGWLMDMAEHFFKGNTDIITLYSPQSFHIAMLIMPITAILSFVVACFTKETFCTRQ